MRVLLVGSGAEAIEARSFDLSKWKVVAMNNAWSICPAQLDVHIYAGDWIPHPSNKVSESAYNESCQKISYQDYDSPSQREKYGRQRIGIGSTMFFNSAYWIIEYLKPSIIGFIGASMNYPQGKANTFYKGGAADPLRFGVRYLVERFNLLEDYCSKENIRLVNFGAEGIMPYPRQSFSDFK